MSERLCDNQNTDIPADLSEAIDEFVSAGRKYREFLKRKYPSRLKGTVYAISDGEMVLYSESELQWGEILKVDFPS